MGVQTTSRERWDLANVRLNPGDLARIGRMDLIQILQRLQSRLID